MTMPLTDEQRVASNIRRCLWVLIESLEACHVRDECPVIGRLCDAYKAYMTTGNEPPPWARSESVCGVCGGTGVGAAGDICNYCKGIGGLLS